MITTKSKPKLLTTTITIGLLAGVFFVGTSTTALECTDGVTSSGVCGTDTADVNVSVEGGWAISVSSAGTLGLDINPTSPGTFSTVTDNLNIYTNIPTGYQLYLNSTSGSTDIYNSSDTSQELAHFSATTGTKDVPVALTNNTWGYSLDNSPTTFAKVALTNDDVDGNIYSSSTKTSSSGDNIPVTYGFMADTKLQPGTYSTSVTYTAIADAPTYTITNVSPNELKLDDQTNKTITIMTSTPATELAFGNITVKIGTIDLTSCTEITSDGYRGTECTFPGGLEEGSYTVALTSSWHSATYTLPNGFSIKNTFGGITTMQEMTSAICSAAPEGTTARLRDIRGRGNAGQAEDDTYGIIKAKDGNCWMTENLDLYNKTVSYTESDFTSGTYTIPNNTPGAASSSGDVMTFQSTPRVYRRTITYEEENYDVSYYSWCTSVALTAASCKSVTGVTTRTTSICPNNWQLPLAGGAATNKSYQKLFATYGSPSQDDFLNPENDAYSLGYRIKYGSHHYSQNITYTYYLVGLWTPVSAMYYTYSYSARSVSYSDSPSYSNDTFRAYGQIVRCVSR